jgi:hypothetical protein
MAGSLLANCDRLTAKQAVTSVVVGGTIQTVTVAASKKIPVVGIVVQVASSGIALGSIITDDQLSEREKWADTIRLAATTGASVGAGIAGATYGAEIGLIGGPVGVGVGMFIGGLVGGLAGGLFGRAIERSPIKVSVVWYDDKYPEITIKNVKDKARYVYIAALGTDSST